jgi:hypothetical protein
MRIGPRVIVKEGDIAASGGPDAGVVPRGEASVLRQGDRPDLRELLAHVLQGAVRGAVVYQDDLPVAQGLLAERGQTVLQEPPAVPVQHHHADQGRLRPVLADSSLVHQGRIIPQAKGISKEGMAEGDTAPFDPRSRVRSVGLDAGLVSPERPHPRPRPHQGMSRWLVTATAAWNGQRPNRVDFSAPLRYTCPKVRPPVGTADYALPSGIMPEQVDPYTNALLSVSPLTWSPSTFVLTVRE